MVSIKNTNLLLVNTDIINNLDSMDLAVYLYICHIAKHSNIICRFNKFIIADYMGITDIKRIDKSLKSLEIGGYINKAKYSYYVEPYQVDLKKYYYTNINIDTINLLIDNKKIYLLNHLLNIYASRDANIKIDDKGYIIGHMPITYFAKLENVECATVIHHNQLLEELKIIYIHHTSYGRGNNLYGSYDDKDMIQHYADQHIINPRVTHKSEGNKKRSLMQKYRWAIAGKQYSKDEIDEINEYIQQKNMNLQPLVYIQTN